MTSEKKQPRDSSTPSRLLQAITLAGVLTTFASAGALAYESKQQKTNPGYQFSYKIPNLPFKLLETGFTIVAAGIIASYGRKPSHSSTLDYQTPTPPESSFNWREYVSSPANRERIAEERKAKQKSQNYQPQPPSQAQTSKQNQ